MVLWINGAVGVGKTSVAEQICRIVSPSHLYDPEQVGYFLWDNFPPEMSRRGDFQHIPLWRQFNRQILQYLSETYHGLIVAPMTLWQRAYHDEIVGELGRTGVRIQSVILTASGQTILDRLAQRGEGADSWAARHIDRCLRAFEDSIPGERIDTEGRSVGEIAEDIVQRIGTPVSW